MSFKDLDIRSKAEIIRVGVRNGMTRIPEIEKAYNEYADGGYTAGEQTDALWQLDGVPYGTPNYNNTINEEEAKAKGWYKVGANGHSDDRVKLSNHPTHPSRGIFNDSRGTYEFSDHGMENPNLTLFGMVDNGDGRYTPMYRGRIVLPELTVTPNGNYYDNTYDQIRLHSKSTGGPMYPFSFGQLPEVRY